MEEGERGLCRIRINLEGDVYLLTYGKPCAVHVDPIEKKPAYHFHPGTKAFSIATAGCCLDCKYCQNWQISQANPEDAFNYTLLPQDVVRAAKRAGCLSVAYTYTEPTVFFEYLIDTARIAREEGLKNVYVTCGYVNQKPLEEIAELMDSANVDLKAFNEDTYRKLTRGSMQPVLNSIKYLYDKGVIVEVTNLVVPTFNDNVEEISEMCKWIAGEVSPDVPLHLSRFHPNYKLKHLPATPVSFMKEAHAVARDAGLNNVYVGNVSDATRQKTICPKCGKIVVERIGYELVGMHIQNGACPQCGKQIYGEWE